MDQCNTLRLPEWLTKMLAVLPCHWKCHLSLEMLSTQINVTPRDYQNGSLNRLQCDHVTGNAH